MCSGSQCCFHRLGIRAVSRYLTSHASSVWAEQNQKQSWGGQQYSFFSLSAASLTHTDTHTHTHTNTHGYTNTKALSLNDSITSRLTDICRLLTRSDSPAHSRASLGCFLYSNFVHHKRLALSAFAPATCAMCCWG